ncbi:uncharacterized protein LOC127087970 [Lathyrus oleraceus]|uniref:uncharacterized protein LOC127087970 n=1 Tax=Pisum sativum TaxID=3888 RepID=UPI0021CF51A1|nr:uncharacterized protein LOC127087970 [Pisum sativum]
MYAKADKSSVYIDARYVWLFSLDVTSWAWGCAALTIMYTSLRVTTTFDTRHLTGYLSLLQCWIYKHFYTICDWRVQHSLVGSHMRGDGGPDSYTLVVLLSYMRWETMVARHLPERCLRQYGYVQRIPRPVLNIPFAGINRWFQSNIINFGRAIEDHAVTVQNASQCEDGYLEWYFSVSHPCIIPPIKHTNDVGACDTGVPVDDVPPPSPTTDVDDQQHL